MKKSSLVWDLPLRVFHWLFVATIFGSWFTIEQGYIENHMLLGYFALSLVIFRILWGFFGTKHSKFIEFIPTPKKLINYILAVKQGKSPYVPGHNPLGSLMVIVMILLVCLQAISGLFIDDDIFSSGPYYGALGSSVGNIMSFIHHNFFDFMLIAIGFHIFAIAFYWKVKKQNLVLPMITGKKSSEIIKEEDKIPHSKIILAIILALLVATFVYWLVVINAPVIEEYY
jgi:cytochrome b